MNAAPWSTGSGRRREGAGRAARRRPAARAGRRLHGRRRAPSPARWPRAPIRAWSTSTCTPTSTRRTRSPTARWTGWASPTCSTSRAPTSAWPPPARGARCCADDDLVLLGAGPEQCTAAERDAIAARDLRPIGVDGLRADPGGAARAALERRHGRRPALPGALRRRPRRLLRRPAVGEHRPRHRRGLRDGARRARRPRSPTTGCSASTVTELNPHHGAQDGADVARLARALAGALARGWRGPSGLGAGQHGAEREGRGERDGEGRRSARSTATSRARRRSAARRRARRRPPATPAARRPRCRRRTGRRPSPWRAR